MSFPSLDRYGPEHTAMLIRLVDDPAESLSVEFKNWIDFTAPQGIEKLVRAVLSIFNRGGGYFLVGFDDTSSKPLPPPAGDLDALYDRESIQQTVSRYASAPIEVDTVLVPRTDGSGRHPVICVPTGVKSPVACKRDIGGTKTGDLLFRTLQANGIVSTSKARPEDWPDIVQVCFENREADVGGFVRRQLAGLDGAAIRTLLELAGGSVTPETGLQPEAYALLDEGRRRSDLRFSGAEFEPLDLAWGGREVAMVISPQLQNQAATQDFMRRVSAAATVTNGTTFVLQSGAALAEWVDHGWERRFVAPRNHFVALDFVRLEASGAIYERRLHTSDVFAAPNNLKPGKSINPIFLVQDVAEAISTGLRIATAMVGTADFKLGFAFRWTGLKGRHLLDHSGQVMLFPGENVGAIEEANGFVELRGDASPLAVAPYCRTATAGVLSTFGGYEASDANVERWVAARLNRAS